MSIFECILLQYKLLNKFANEYIWEATKETPYNLET